MALDNDQRRGYEPNDAAGKYNYMKERAATDKIARAYISSVHADDARKLKEAEELRAKEQESQG